MNNKDAQNIINDCLNDLKDVQIEIANIGATQKAASYLTYYGLIRACGAIEMAFKMIIADFCSNGTKNQVKTFIDSRIRNHAYNPSFGRIRDVVSSFDKQWSTDFTDNVDKMTKCEQKKQSLASLVNLRNEFAHGGKPHASINDIVTYYKNGVEIIKELDNVIC